MKTDSTRVPKVVAENLRELLKRQRERKKGQSWDVRLVDPMLGMFGSMRFLWLNLLVFVIWILVNTGQFSFLRVFDPYPFEFLTLSVSLEAIFLSVIVLIGQNELQKDADERADLDLQINILAEKESTISLLKLARIEKHLGIGVSEAESQLVEELIQETDPITVIQEIEQEHLKPQR